MGNQGPALLGLAALCSLMDRQRVGNSALKDSVLSGAEGGLRVLCGRGWGGGGGGQRTSLCCDDVGRPLNSATEWLLGGRTFWVKGTRTHTSSGGNPQWQYGSSPGLGGMTASLTERRVTLHVSKGPVLAVCCHASQNVRCVDSHDVGRFLKRF